MKFVPDNFKTKIIKYLLSFLQAQLVVSLVSIPILVGWGLQTSIMTFVGNLLFLPVLVFFLILSSLIFFMQLCHISNGFLIRILELTGYVWASILSQGQKIWLFGFCKPSGWILVLIPVISFLILYTIKNRSSIFKTVVMGINLIAVLIFLVFYPAFCKKNKSFSFENGKLIINIDKRLNTTILDNGFFSMHSSYENFVNFQLKQFLIKNTGSLTVQSLHLSRPGFRAFKAAQECCLKLNVKKIILPYFETKLTKRAWVEFFRLKKIMPAITLTGWR